MNIKFVILFWLLSYILVGCVKENNPVEDCGKWEVEINNPEATVKIEDGKLIVDIQNPKTVKDIRLIQRQDPLINHPEIGAALSIVKFQTTAVKAASRDAQISMSVAYETNPSKPFIRASYGPDISNYYVGDAKVFDRMQGNGRLPSELLLFASGEKAAFERDARTFDTPLISAASKVFYLDFGIDPFITREFPTKSIHIELDIFIFGNYTGTQNTLTMPTGYNKTNYGFIHDLFDCNSLK